jgi:undecaprenyl-diphosphatase
VNVLQAVILGVVEGITEFLPVSSTGHLTVTEKLLGLQIDDKGVTAFTAIIQVGAILAVVIYFWKDIVRLIVGFFRGLAGAEGRAEPVWRECLFLIIGTIPIAIFGLLFKDLIEGGLRSLWVVAAALVLWSAVIMFAERAATQQRGEGDVRIRDAVLIGLAQCIAVVPGVSRSGATISAGLLLDLDRVAATRLSFLLSIPALTAAGGLEAVSAAGDVSASVGWGATAVGTLVSAIVAYVSIAWLLKLVSHHRLTVFVWYRVPAGLLLAALLAFGAISAT